MKRAWLSTYVLASIVLLAGCTLQAISQSGSSPADENSDVRATITAFCEAILHRDKATAGEFLTSTPNYVSKRALEESLRIAKVSRTLDKPHSTDNVNDNTKVECCVWSKEQLFDRIVECCFSKTSLSEIETVQRKGVEARVRIRMKHPRGSEFADLSYDVFLYREEDGWKIFEISYPKRADLDDMGFYAQE